MITSALCRERARSTIISSLTAYEKGWEAVYTMVMFMTRYDYATGKFSFIKTELDGVKKGRKNWNGMGRLSMFLLCVLWVEDNGCCGEDNAAAHKVVIVLEIEIGSWGKAVGCESIYHLGKPSEYYPILSYKLRRFPRFEVFSHY